MSAIFPPEKVPHEINHAITEPPQKPQGSDEANNFEIELSHGAGYFLVSMTDNSA